MERQQINIREIRNGNGVNFEIPLSDDFGINLNQGDTLNTDYIEEIKKENINKIVNYEKYIFYPAYLNREIYFSPDGSFIDKDGLLKVNDGEGEYSTDLDEYSRDITKIAFNLYLKHREHGENNDYGSWGTSDEYYWNRWDGTKKGGKKTMNDELSTKSNGDLLGCLGFADEDIFYQKNNLKKSFLRISVYDSPYKQTQKLLYYSTLFFDSNVLYKKYVKLNSVYPKQDNNELRVYQTKYKKSDGNTNDIPDEDKLTATFTCTSKSDDTACSDGFYLYLFNAVVDNGKCTKLYMKVEFNNAKYGKTVALTNPREKTLLVDVIVSGDTKVKSVPIEQAREIKNNLIQDGTPESQIELKTVNRLNKQIPLSDNRFPEDYEVIYSGSNAYIDVKKLYEDLYIPIFVRYNNKKNRYEWYIASNEQVDKIKSGTTEDKDPSVITINLYEPRINNLENHEIGQNT